MFVFTLILFTLKDKKLMKTFLFAPQSLKFSDFLMGSPTDWRLSQLKEVVCNSEEKPLDAAKSMGLDKKWDFNNFMLLPLKGDNWSEHPNQDYFSGIQVRAYFRANPETYPNIAKYCEE